MNASTSPARASRRAARPGALRRLLASFCSHHRPYFSFAVFWILLVSVWAFTVGFLAIDWLFPDDPHPAFAKIEPASSQHPWQEDPLILLASKRFLGIATFVAALTVVAYAAIRASLLHPFYNHRYWGWLETTPWRHPQPLPMGPVHLTWQDVVLFGLAFAPFVRYPQVLAILGAVFFAVYVGVLALAAWQLGGAAQAYASTAILGLALRLSTAPYVACAVAFLAYLVAWQGFNRSLMTFPWPSDNWFSRTFGKDIFRDSRPDPNRQSTLSPERFPFPWPIDVLLGPEKVHGCSVQRAGLAACQASWWAYAAAGRVVAVPNASLTKIDKMAFALCSVMLIFGTMMRLLQFGYGFAPPLSLAGRIVLRKFVLPAYDVRLVAPCTMLVVGGASLLAWKTLHLPTQFGAAATAGLTVFLGLALGPTFADWRLVGGHRLTPIQSRELGEI